MRDLQITIDTQKERIAAVNRAYEQGRLSKRDMDDNIKEARLLIVGAQGALNRKTNSPVRETRSWQ